MLKVEQKDDLMARSKACAAGEASREAEAHLNFESCIISEFCTDDSLNS